MPNMKIPKEMKINISVKDKNIKILYEENISLINKYEHYIINDKINKKNRNDNKIK